jgi:hypothetical protein
MYVTLAINTTDDLLVDLRLRYVLADTLEARHVGHVLEEGYGSGLMYIRLSCLPENLENIKSILTSLNIQDSTDIYCD